MVALIAPPPTSLPHPEDVVMRSASDDELERLAKTFGEAIDARGSYRVLVRGRHGRIVGFSCLLCGSGRGGGAHFRWRVLRRFEGTCFEEQLVTAAMIDAEAVCAPSLEAAEMLVSGSREDRLLDKLGFSIAQNDHLYDVDFAEALRRTDRAWRRLHERGRIPAGAVVVPLDESNWPNASQLAAENGLLSRERSHVSLEFAGFCPAISPVILLDGVVAGVLLVASRGRFAEVAAEVLDERLRAGPHWPHALLLAYARRWMAAAGIEVLRFRCHPKLSRETLNFARRCGGRLVAVQNGRVLSFTS